MPVTRRESFKLHEQLADELGLETYRKIPTLSVAGGVSLVDVNPPVSWLDGQIARAGGVGGRRELTRTVGLTPQRLSLKDARVSKRL